MAGSRKGGVQLWVVGCEGEDAEMSGPEEEGKSKGCWGGRGRVRGYQGCWDGKRVSMSAGESKTMSISEGEGKGVGEVRL